MGLRVLESAVSASPEWNWHVVAAEDSFDPRSNLQQFRTFANNKKYPIMISNDRGAVSEFVKKIKPQVGLVCGWYEIFGPDVISLPLGLWGVHNSLLPMYRGGSPIVWAMINGEKEVGSSLFRLERKIDSGVIAGQVRVRVGQLDDISSVTNKLERKMSKLVYRTWPLITSGNHSSFSEQDEHQASYFKIRSDKDGEIDWTLGGIEIYDFIRAQTRPYRGAFFYDQDIRYRVYKARIADEPALGAPGTVETMPNNWLRAASGDGQAILITDYARDA